ncbi:hypothetical protein KFL_002670010 [Klebsormidium nitens]|uniref:Myb domain protein n=1 Tax=Klebsormidium nitens TaxID=105231 RepID=A0A1Y1I515_KLENI|nr:hypothetical protein KFL_002670010 [Klebsormidium nitens]|eukprot:GAQ86040.1 hypothetical protein KFL_002670010 [Klebsormidium nitens]
MEDCAPAVDTQHVSQEGADGGEALPDSAWGGQHWNAGQAKGRGGREGTRKGLNLSRGSRSWSKKEDSILLLHVAAHGEAHWRKASEVYGLNRSDKSCRLRFKNHLAPSLKKTPLSDVEWAQIIELHKLYGNKWTTIASKLPGRTDNEVKNAWYTQLKRAERKRKELDLAKQPRFAMASSIESNELSTNQKQRPISATSGIDTEGDSARAQSAPQGRGANQRNTAWDLTQEGTFKFPAGTGSSSLAGGFPRYPLGYPPVSIAPQSVQSRASESHGSWLAQPGPEQPFSVDDFLLSSPLPLAPTAPRIVPAERSSAPFGGPSPLQSAANPRPRTSLRFPSPRSVRSLTSQPSAISVPSASTARFPAPSTASGPYGSGGAAASAPLWTLQQLMASCEPEPEKLSSTTAGPPAMFRFPPSGSRNVSGGPGFSHVPGGTFPRPTEAPAGGMRSPRAVNVLGGAPWRFQGDFDGESSPWQPVQLRAGIWTVTGDSWGPAVQPAPPPFRPVATDIRPRTQRQRITSLSGMSRTNNLRVRVDNPSGEYPRQENFVQSLDPWEGPQQTELPQNPPWDPATDLSLGPARGLSPVQAPEHPDQGLVALSPVSTTLLLPVSSFVLPPVDPIPPGAEGGLQHPGISLSPPPDFFWRITDHVKDTFAASLAPPAALDYTRSPSVPNDLDWLEAGSAVSRAPSLGAYPDTSDVRGLLSDAGADAAADAGAEGDSPDEGDFPPLTGKDYEGF